MFTSSQDKKLPWTAESRTVHLWRQMMQMRSGFDKNARFPADSPFEELCRRFLQKE
jgi:hypothetical protein